MDRSEQGDDVDNESLGPGTTVEAAGIPRAERALESFAALVCRISPGLVVVWLCAVAASMVGHSRQKPLWNDELIFRWTAALPTARDVWWALKLGADSHPPLAPLLVHWLIRAFGSGALLLRLPSMVGVCAMLLCLFLTLRRHIGPFYALLGLLVPFCTVLPVYGYDATPYGLLYGSLAFAVYCWDKAGDRDRSWWAVAFGLALAMALGCHFYAVFALPAFYLAEGARILRRRVNWPMIGAMALASATELLYWPIAASNHRQYSGTFWAKPHWGSMPDMLAGTMGGLAVPAYVVLLLAATFVVLRFRFVRENEDQGDSRFRELTTLALGLLLIPLLGWVAGMIVLKAFYERHVLHGLLGVFLLVPLFAFRALGGNRSLLLALLLAFGLPASFDVVQGLAADLKAPARQEDFARIERELPKLGGDIVVSNMHVFTQLVDYSPALKARCILLWDREKELQYAGNDTTSQGAPVESQLGFYRAEAWSDFADRNGTFLVLVAPAAPDMALEWVRPYLKASGRYGDTVMKAGQYAIVRAKPAEPGATEGSR